MRICFVSCFLWLSCTANGLETTYIVRNIGRGEVAVDPYDARVCQEQVKIDKNKKVMQEQPGVMVTIQTVNGCSVKGTFFDRGSNKLLIMGQAICDPRETMHFYARVFHDYDVLLFDYKWRDIKNFVFNRQTWKYPMRAFFDSTKEEVVSAVQYARSLKKYRKVIGLGICYSAYQFLYAQSDSYKQGVDLFDALILDSCFLSTAEAQRLMLRNIFLPRSLSQSEGSRGLKRFWAATHIPDLLTWLLAKITDYSTLPLCSQIGQIPVLCIYGKADKLVPATSFECIWESLKTPYKMALITPSAHIMNIRNQAIYKVVCDQFIDSI